MAGRGCGVSFGVTELLTPFVNFFGRQSCKVLMIFLHWATMKSTKTNAVHNVPYKKIWRRGQLQMSASGAGKVVSMECRESFANTFRWSRGRDLKLENNR